MYDDKSVAFAARGMAGKEFSSLDWVKDNREYASEFPTLGGKKFKKGEQRK